MSRLGSWTGAHQGRPAFHSVRSDGRRRRPFPWPDGLYRTLSGGLDRHAPPAVLLRRNEYRTLPEAGQLKSGLKAWRRSRFHESVNAQMQNELWQTIDKR